MPPVTLTVNAGETLAEAKVKTKHNLSPTQHETLVLNFTTISVMYPLDNDKMEIIMKDLEAGKGSKLLDERWVYDHPGIPFASSGRQTAVVEQYGDAVLMKSGCAS